MILFPLLLALLSSAGRGRSHELRGRLGLHLAKPGGLRGRMFWLAGHRDDLFVARVRGLVTSTGADTHSTQTQHPANLLVPWLDANHEEVADLNYSDARDIVREVADWLRTDPTAKLGTRSMRDARAAARAYFAHASHHQRGVRPGTVLYVWPDGARIERLTTSTQLDEEGEAMSSCVGAAWQWDLVHAGAKIILSLRDATGQPRATISLVSTADEDDEMPDSGWMVEEVQGHHNDPVPLPHDRKVRAFLMDLRHAENVRLPRNWPSSAKAVISPNQAARASAPVRLVQAELAARMRELQDSKEAYARAWVDAAIAAEPKVATLIESRDAAYRMKVRAGQVSGADIFRWRAIKEQIVAVADLGAPPRIRNAASQFFAVQHLGIPAAERAVAAATHRMQHPDGLRLRDAISLRARRHTDYEHANLLAAINEELTNVMALLGPRGWTQDDGGDYWGDAVAAFTLTDPQQLGGIEVAVRRVDWTEGPVWDQVLVPEHDDEDVESGLDAPSLTELLIKLGTLVVHDPASGEPAPRVDPEPGHWVVEPAAATSPHPAQTQVR